MRGLTAGAPQARWGQKQPLRRLAESVQAAPSVPGRKDVTLRKLDIKVETVNREPLTMHSDREDDTASVSTATRVMKAIYSVRVRSSLAQLPSHSWDRLHPSSAVLSLPPPSVILPWSCPLPHMLTRSYTYTRSRTYIHVHMHIHKHIHVPTLPRLISLH